MDTTYRLTQTGKQVQDLLDQVTPNEVSIAAETERAQAAEQAIRGDLSSETTRATGAETTLQNNINSEESARIAADSVLQGEIDDEEARAKAAEQAIQGDLADETARATGAETTLQGNINAEASARQSADQVLQGNIDAEATARQNADSTLQGNIDAEEARAMAAEQANATAIAGIEAKIPSEASAQNQLADKSFVNSSVATATATFRGTYNLVNDLHLNVGATRAKIITELNATIQNADNNDYCFVQIPVSTSKPTEIAAVDRYKFNGSTWGFEYSLNNSGFTEAQWDALNSGITSGLVAKLDALPTNADLVASLATKQDNLTFDQTPTANSQNPVTSAGIKAAIDAASGGSTSALDAEIERAQAAEQALQEDIDDEIARAQTAEQTNATAIAGIQAKIPAEASAQNQLADKAYVDTSIATDSATFRGSFNLVTDLQLTISATRVQIAAALGGTIPTADNNDYAFVQIPVADATPNVIARVERYKFNGTAWAFEYELNNSGFTQAQWDALNSGITSGLVAKLNALPTNADLVAALATKQDNLTFDQTPTANSQNPVTSAGIKAAIDAASGGSTSALDAEIARAQAAEQALQDNIDAEATARQNADTTLQGNIDAEATRAQTAEQANADDIDAIEAKIPSAATAQNQLADKAYVDQSLQTDIAAEATARQNADTTLQGNIDAEATRAQTAEQANADDIDAIEAKIPSAASAQNQLADKAYVDQSLQTDIAAEATARQNADTTLQGNIDAEESRAKAAEQANADDIDAIEAKIPSAASAQNQLADKAYVDNVDTTLQGNINAEATRAQAAEQANAADIDAIEAKIPSAASAQNQLADKAYVNSSIETNTATFRGTYNLVNDLGLTVSATHAQIETALSGQIATADKNDYAFVQIPVSNDSPTVISSVERYKFNGTAWDFEFTLNNSGFTQAQWDAINSGITSGLVAKLSALPAIAELTSMFAAKQDNLTFDQTPTVNSQNPVTSGGIKGAIDTAVGAEETRARAAEQVNALGISDIDAKIPTQASAQNQLADKAFVNNAISTNTGDFVGTYNSLAALEADNPNPNNNDYGYVVSTDQQGNTSYSRYKYSTNTNQWEFEYALNNSSFTSEEWAAIQSGITSALVTKLSDLYTRAQLDVILDSKQSALTFDDAPTEGSDNPVKSGGIYNALAQKQNTLTFDALPVQGSQNPVTSGGVFNALANKQDNLTFDNAPTQGSNNPVKSGGIYTALANKQDAISDLATIRSGAAAGATAYQKPLTGIPETDLAQGVQDSLDAADTAYQKPSGGIPKTDLAQGVQDSLDAADTAIQDVSGKADKVSGATENDFAGLDANGNLKDSGKKASDFATAAQGALADTAYQKPSGGIPDTDLSAAVQTSLGKADTAIQDVSGKADKVSGATENDFAGLDSNGNLKDSGKKASDFATAAQGALADTAYQKPSGGIPSTDLASAVNTSLGKADTAYQKPSGGIPDTDLASGVQTDLGKAATAYQKPSAGIPSSDMTSAVQTSLGKADTAYQKPSGGIPSTDLASAVNTSLGKADTAYQKPSGGIPYADLAANAKGLPIGAGTVTSLASLPVTNRLIIATISANQSAVSINNGVSALPAGAELHVIIHATAAVTITLPTSSPYVNCNAESALEVASGGYAELNFVSDGTNIYVRGIV